MLKLIEMKKERKRQKSGNVFIVQPYPNFYIYGRVINSYLEIPNSFCDGCHMIVFYKLNSKDFMLSDLTNLEKTELLTNPIIVHPLFWSKGLFNTISNVPLSLFEEKRIYPFFNINTKKVVDVYNRELNIDRNSAYILGPQSIGGIEEIIRRNISLKIDAN